MMVIKVIVDEMPKGCDSCTLNFHDGNNAYCTALITEQNEKKSLNHAALVFGMHNYRRHDCPLTLEIDKCNGENPYTPRV